MTTNEIEERPLPEGWAWVSASDICSSVRDGTHDTPKYVDEGIPLITSKNLRPTGLNFENIKFISIYDHVEISKRSGVERGDILFAMIGTIGNPVIVKTNEAFSIKNVGLFKKNPEVVIPEYLKYWLESWDLNRILQERELVKGTTQKFIPLGHLRILPVPFAPLPEQERIVAEIEKQFARLDQAVASLKRAQAKLARYKASVLKAACEGRLVPHDPDDEPAEKLLQRILAERRARWEAQEWQKLVIKAQQKVAQAHRKAASRPARLSDLQPEEWQDLPEAEYSRYLPKNDKWKEKYKEPAVPDTADLPSLPDGWVWTITDVLAANEANAICAGPFGTIFKARDFRPTGVPIIFLRHVQPGKYAPHRKPGYMDTQKWDELFQGYSVYGGEILVTKLGEPPGVSAIYPKGIGPAMVTPDVMKMTVNHSVASANYLMHYFNSETARRFSSGAAFGTTRLRLTLPIFREMPVPLPPLTEQERIVDEVERHLSVIEANEQAIAVDLARAERLRQSILQQAFSGRLVTRPQRSSETSEV